MEKLHAVTHEFAPLKPLLLCLFRVAAMFEQRETNPCRNFPLVLRCETGCDGDPILNQLLAFAKIYQFGQCEDLGTRSTTLSDNRQDTGRL